MKRTCIVLFCFLILSASHAQIAIKDISGHFISFDNIRGRYLLVLVFNPANLGHRLSLMYAEVLSKKLPSIPLTILGISTGDIGKTLAAKKLCKISFPLSLDWPKMFIDNELTGCCGATILFDQDHKIIFRDNDVLTPDLLRQLLLRQLNIDERLLQGPIIWDPPFLKGDIFVDFPVLEIADGKTKKLYNKLKKINLFTFFSSFSFCSNCKHNNRLETLDKIAALNDHDLFIAVFFLEPFTAEDVFSIKKHKRVKFDTFLIPNFMSDDNIYITDDRLKCDPWTIVVDKNGSVLWVELPGISENIVETEVIRLLQDYLEGKR